MMPQDISRLAEGFDMSAIKKRREEEKEHKGEGGGVLTSWSSTGGPLAMPCEVNKKVIHNASRYIKSLSKK